MNKKLNILFIEDSEDDTLLEVHLIEKGGYDVNFNRVERAVDMNRALNEKKWDIILSDYAMPYFNGLEALTLLKESELDIPFVIISGTIGEEVAVEAMKAGAQDYIMKNNLKRLLPAVERELREAKGRAERRLLEKNKKLAEEALRESEKRYRRITESLTDYQYFVSIKENKVVKTVQSPACQIITGYSPEEFAANPFLWYQMIVPEDREMVQSCIAEILDGNDIPPIEHRIKRKDGDIRWVRDTTILLKDSSGKLLSYDGVIKDITEKKKAEIEIARANRALRMLSDSNQALIQINTEKELLNEVCRIIVEVGGYCLAWVGLLEGDKNEFIMPVAYASVNSDNVLSQKINLDENKSDQDPIRIAVRTKNMSVLKNITSDNRELAWFNSTFHLDQKSIIILPLINDGICFGIIAISSYEEDVFDIKEVEILKELSEDVSFGIASVRIREQKRIAEEALRASEERFSAAFKYSPIAMAIFRDVDGVIVDTNDVFTKNSGYSREEIIGKTTSDLELYSNPADREKIINILKSKGVVESFEFQTKTKSGEIRDALSALTYIYFNNEKHYLSHIIDITERKKSEKQLIILNAALEAAANAIVVTNVNGEIIWNNKSFSSLTGYSNNEVKGHTPGELINSGVHGKEFFKTLWTTILKGDIWSGEIINRRKDKSQYTEYMTVTPVRDKENRISHFIAVKQDITERKLAEKALQDSERKYRIIADNTYNWEFWTDSEGKYIYCSPSCYRVSGYTSKEFLQNDELKFDIIHPDYQKEFYSLVNQRMRYNEVVNMHFKIIHKDGSERWIEYISQPVYDENGNFLGRRGSNSDITEKKETDRKILNAIITTEETERNKFSQELHDGLGPILSTVKLYFQWLADTKDSEKQKDIAKTGLQNIDEAIQTLREVSNNLSPRVLTNFGLIPAIKHLVSGINQTRAVNIRFDYDQEQRYDSKIEITLYRIVSELINNTLKYAKARNIFINLSVNKMNDRIEFRFADDGKGFDISKVMQSKSGLGIQNIIQRVNTLDGLINFDTKKGEPLKVRIELPLSKS